MGYIGRPGVSPAVATLIARDEIRATDRILDVGCGTGTEALLLAAWGCTDIDGIDADAKEVRIARGRATRRKLGKQVRFHHMDAVDLPGRFKPRTFDIVLHTLVSNNLKEEAVEPHFRAIRGVMKRNGLIVVQERMHRKYENKPPDEIGPRLGVEEHFEVTPGVSTHLPEGDHRDPYFAPVVVWIGRPRR